MLLKTAIRITAHEKAQFAGAVAGVTIATFLVLLQWGLYFGYKRDTTVVLDAIDADIWIVPKGQPSFDGFTCIDDLALFTARQTPGVQHAARVIWAYSAFRNPLTGANDNAQVLGFDFDSGIGISLKTSHRNLSVLLRPDGHILLGKKGQVQFGVHEIGIAGCEINGRHAEVVGFVDDIHLFTTFGFVVTDIDNAREFLDLPPSHTTYLVCKCRPGTDIHNTIRRLKTSLPEHDVYSAKEFHILTSRYWRTKTRIGPVLLSPAIAAWLVGFVLVAMTFYISTIQKISLYASLKVIGATTSEIAVILFIQVLIVFAAGCTIAIGSLWPILLVLERTTISVVITPGFAAIACLLFLLSSLVGVLFSVRRIVTIDPGIAFRV